MSESIPLLQELPNQQDIDGASGARLFQITAIGKGNSEDFPYNVPNEKIASELARLVGLPVPEEAMKIGFERIAAIPDYFIEHTVGRLPRGLITDEEAEFVVDFLCRRKTQMESIVLQHPHRFPGLKMPAAS